MADPIRSNHGIAPVASYEGMTEGDRRAFREAVARGRAQIKAGQVVDGDEVAKWVASWGQDDELPRPVPASRT